MLLLLSLLLLLSRVGCPTIFSAGEGRKEGGGSNNGPSAEGGIYGSFGVKEEGSPACLTLRGLSTTFTWGGGGGRVSRAICG